MIDDKDEYLVMKAISAQDKQKINPSLIDKTRRIPRQVATPLPPLNFNQTGNICPRIAARPDKKTKFGKKTSVMRTAALPFKISRNKVRIAKSLFPVLKTFVAPIFLDPIVLISFFKKVFVNIKPNGTEPNI